METLINIFAPIALFVAGIVGVGPDNTSLIASVEQPSVEFGLSEVSPKGESGGFAMPASGCSAASPEWHGEPVHDCALVPEINVNKSIIRLGDPIIVSWDPRTNTNCILSNNVMVLPPATPDGNVADSRISIPTGETTYSIVCDGAGNEDSASVKVLPRIQET
jgi:hypothetical protein